MEDYRKPENQIARFKDKLEEITLVKAMSSSKYGDLIRQARNQENQEERKSDSQEQPTDVPQTPNQPDNQLSVKTENQLARQPENQLTIEPVNQPVIKQDSQKPLQPPELEVNLCVKVPKSLRQHWAAEAKREGTTMTAVIVEALKERFGMPE